jgi:hypothetical protein
LWARVAVGPELEVVVELVTVVEPVVALELVDEIGPVVVVELAVEVEDEPAIAVLDVAIVDEDDVGAEETDEVVMLAHVAALPKVPQVPAKSLAA